MEIGPSFFHSINFVEDFLNIRETRESSGTERGMAGKGGIKERCRHSVSVHWGTHFWLGPRKRLLFPPKGKKLQRFH